MADVASDWEDVTPQKSVGGDWEDVAPHAQPMGDIARLKNSFADPQTREKLNQMANSVMAPEAGKTNFLGHPINWAESHAGDVLPFAGQVAGGVGGTALGGMVGAPISGALAGAGAGAAGGEGLRAGIGKLLGVNQAPVSDQAAQAAKEGYIGEAIGKPIAGALGYMGKSFYNSALRPAIEAGERAGTPGIEDVLYRNGVKTATNLPEKATAIANNIQQDVITPTLEKAQAAGATVSPEEFLAPLKEMRNKMAGIRSPEAESALKSIDEKIAYYEGQVKGTPAVPPSNTQVPSPILDSSGQPIMKTVTTPGAPAIPGKPYSPVEATQAKTLTGYDQPVLSTTKTGQKINNRLYTGLMQGTEKSVEDSLGPEAAAALHEGNQDIGKILASGMGQKTSSVQAGRALENLASLRGTDAIAALLDMSNPLEAIAAKKGINAMQAAQMPVGYAIKKFTGSPTAVNSAIAAGTQSFKPTSGWQDQPVAGVGR